MQGVASLNNRCKMLSAIMNWHGLRVSGLLGNNGRLRAAHIEGARYEGTNS